MFLYIKKNVPVLPVNTRKLLGGEWTFLCICRTCSGLVQWRTTAPAYQIFVFCGTLYAMVSSSSPPPPCTFLNPKWLIVKAKRRGSVLLSWQCEHPWWHWFKFKLCRPAVREEKCCMCRCAGERKKDMKVWCNFWILLSPIYIQGRRKFSMWNTVIIELNL